MPPISIELALIAGRALFLVFCFVVAAIAFTRWRRAADRSTAQFTEQTTAVLERISTLEKQLEMIQASQTEILEKMSSNGAATTNTPTPSYQIAIRMARSGASFEELMSSCGITRREAELVQRLHAPAAKLRIAAVS